MTEDAEEMQRLAASDPELAELLRAQQALQARIAAKAEEARRPKWDDQKHLPELYEMMTYLASGPVKEAMDFVGQSPESDKLLDRIQKMAAKPFLQWTEWDRDRAFIYMNQFRGILEKGGFSLNLVPVAPPKPTRGEPIKEVQWDKENNWLIVHYENLTYSEISEIRYSVHSVPGFRYFGNDIRFPSDDKHACKRLPDFLKRHDFEIPEGFEEYCQQVIEKAELTLKLSRAVDLASVGITEFTLPTTLGGTLRPFQVAGVAYVAEIWKRYQHGVLIADEMGLGKTMEALASAETMFSEQDWKRGLLILVPPSLALKWYQESTKWLPHRITSILEGGKAQSLKGNIIICPYSVLRYVKVERNGNTAEEDNEILWMIKQRPWAGVVSDEFHYIKNETSMRSRAVREVVAETKPWFRLGLTGSPVLNRAAELAPQLEALGVLEKWGTRWTFEREAIGNPLEVHEKLREMGFLRREKEQVLKDLPPKQRDVIPVDMPGKIWKEYRYMEAEFKKWLREELHVDEDPEGFQKYMRAMRAEILVKIEKLSHKVAQGKVDSVLDNAKGFLNDSDQKLIIFAHHIDIQRHLVEELGDYGVAWLAGTSVMDRKEQYDQVGRFQEDPECRVIVASMKAGSHGHDLFAASNVMMMELDWGPEPHNQAEDRAHRIGQKGAVNAHFMLTPQTIDDYRMALIDSKRRITGALNRGIKVEEDELLATMLSDFMESRAADADKIVKDAAPEVWQKLMTGELTPAEEDEEGGTAA